LLCGAAAITYFGAAIPTAKISPSHIEIRKDPHVNLPVTVLRKIKGRIARMSGRSPPPPAAIPLHHPMQFDPATLPWIDRPHADVDAYVASLGSRPASYDLREQLVQWQRDGFAIFPQLIPREMIDAYRADVDELVRNRARYNTRVLLEDVGITRIRKTTEDQLEHPHARIMDFHNQSVIAKKMVLHPTIVDFLRHLFRDDVVAMQTLTFWRGSEQWTHQDAAYVVSQIPSHLAATWIALEDVHPDAGPLEYFPGSHRLPNFDFGNGMFLTPKSTRTDLDFRDYLEAECAKAGIGMQTFCPRKGDVLFWHATLAHRGGKVNDRARTRLSLVTHYSSRSGYPRDRRAIYQPPRVHAYNGAYVYGDPMNPRQEDCFERGKAFA
jgi:hypothetical protein